MIHLITTLIIFTLKIFNIYSSWSEISLNFRKCLSLDCHEFFGRNTPNDVKRMLLDFHRHKGLMLKMFTQSYIYVEVIYISQMLPSRVAPTGAHADFRETIPSSSLERTSFHAKQGLSHLSFPRSAQR